MIEIGKRDIDRIGRMLNSLHPFDSKQITAWFDKEPKIAREAIIEAARALMAAKCIALSPNDKAFFRECTALVALSLQHHEVTVFFTAIAKIDLNALGDRMRDHGCLIAHERIEKLKESLG